MERNQETDEISAFLQGHNELKYLVNVETYYHTNVAHCIIHPPNAEPQIRSIVYTPFLYLKDLEKNNIELYGGNHDMLKQAIEMYGITVERLITGNQPRLEDGFCIKVSSSVSYNNILKFLKEGGLDMWEKHELKEFSSLKFPVQIPNWYDIELHKNILKLLRKNKRYEAAVLLSMEQQKYAQSYDSTFLNWAITLLDYLKNLIGGAYKYKHLFYSIKPDEQFFISTGCRLYKGFEVYSDLHKVTFDIETTGLRYEYCRVFMIGIRDNRGNEIILKVDKENDDLAERNLIIKFFNYYNHLKPAIISGYNSEDFDFEFIVGRAKILEINLAKIRTTLDVKEYVNKEGVQIFARTIKRKENSSVKFGGSTERYTATQIWGYSVVDIHHAAKRTASVNSEMKNTKLKYVCKFEKIAKPNRMYVDGDVIFKTWKENRLNIINPVNNHFEEIPVQLQNDAQLLRVLYEQKSKLDNDTYQQKRKEIYSSVNQDILAWIKARIGKYTPEFKIISGSEIVEQYLLDDLWETEKVDELYNQSSFLLAKIIPTSYSRICTMGNAAVWNLIMTTWSYEKGLAIPCPDNPEKFSGGLARCYKKGYSENIVKIDFKSMYPHNQLEYDIFPIFDITGVIKKLLNYLTTQRNEFKFLAGDKSPLPKAERNAYKVKQLPLKILNNSLFGALGSGIAFNWSDNTCAAKITCTGRIQLRQAITWFMKYGFDPLLAVTDGINFAYPKYTDIDLNGNKLEKMQTIEEAWVYMDGDKKLVGLEAIVEKFNVEEMHSDYIGVDLDGTWKSSLNLSRINYANLTEEEIDEKTGKVIEPKIKFTGNTIKSKTMSEYIEEFIDKGMKLILSGKGEEFVEYYNEYLKKIYFKQIPLRKIATKKRYKSTIAQYQNRGKDKTGKKKAKQAHMELILQDRNMRLIKEYVNLYGEDDSSMEEKQLKAGHLLPPEPELDSYIFYVNIGKKKGQGDSAIIKNDLGEDIIASQMISAEDLESNPDMTGDYNVEKYVGSFNKRIETILEGFDPEVRGQILIKNPAKREYLDSKDLILKNFVADDYEESLVLEEKELELWNRTGYDPTKIWDGFKLPTTDALKELKSYADKIEYLNSKFKESGQSKVVKSVNDKIENGDFVLIKNFKTYNLYVYNGTYLKCVRKNLVFPDDDMRDYDFLDAGLSNATINLKKGFVIKFKNTFNIPQEVHLSTIPKALEMFEEYYAIELAEMKKKTKKKKKDEEMEEDDLEFLGDIGINLTENTVD